MNKRRLPSGYVGTNHETIGSDIIAVLNALFLPESVLGGELFARLKVVKADQWYPIALLLELLDTLDAKVAKLTMIQTGRRLFAMSHEERFKKVASSAGDVVFGIDGLYHFANRGTGIGGWTPIKFQPGFAVIEKRTPHHCVMEEGILAQSFSTVGVPALVKQKQCLRDGHDCCVFEVSSLVRDQKWIGTHKLL